MAAILPLLTFCLVLATVATVHSRYTEVVREQEGCPAVEKPRNGWKRSEPWYPRSQKRFKTGDVIKFNCFGGHTRIGEKSITCMENGQWSANVPKCKATSCVLHKLHEPENGKKYGTEESFGSVVRFSCNRGYRMIGSKEVKCKRSGKWTTTSPWCRPECDFVKCKPGQKCTYDMEAGMTKCICMDPSECPFVYQPVCGPNLKTYANRCILGSTECNAKISAGKFYEGECVEENEADPYCPPCPTAKICPVFWKSTYSFLGTVVEKFNNKGDSIILLNITEAYKPIKNMKSGDVIDILHKTNDRKCSCVSEVPEAGRQMYLFGHTLTTTRDGREGMPVIDENAYVEEFYSHDQMSLCWLYR